MKSMLFSHKHVVGDFGWRKAEGLSAMPSSLERSVPRVICFPKTPFYCFVNQAILHGIVQRRTKVVKLEITTEVQGSVFL